VQNELDNIVKNTVEGLNYILWGYEYRPQRESALLRIFIEKESGDDTGISVDDCAIVSDCTIVVVDFALVVDCTIFIVVDYAKNNVGDCTTLVDDCNIFIVDDFIIVVDYTTIVVD
jgi:hypothetical protein